MRVELKNRLRAGDLILDREFDELLPGPIAQLSSVYWTPIAVAVAAAKFLTAGRESARILDVGSGAGKFCAVAGASSGAFCVGIDRNEELVRVARDVVEQLELSTVRFHVGDALSLDWHEFDGIYFYNPFTELFPEVGQPIDSVRAGYAQFSHSVRTTLAKLYLMPQGTRVATYHGIGGAMPPGYELVGGSFTAFGELRFYVRADPLAPDHASDFEETTKELRDEWSRDAPDLCRSNAD